MTNLFSNFAYVKITVDDILAKTLEELREQILQIIKNTVL